MLFAKLFFPLLTSVLTGKTEAAKMCNPEKEYRKKQRAATQAVREQEKKERKEYQQAKTRGLIQTTTPFVGANIVTGHVGLGHHW